MLDSPHAYNAISGVDKITLRLMIMNFHGNPQTTFISCYSPTNVSYEQEPERFYTDLTLTRQIPKHNVPIIEGDFNVQHGQNDGFKYSFHKLTNRNGKMLKYYLL